LLFDAGFSGRQLRERLGSIGAELDDLSAVVVSHEHTDHIAGLRVLGRRFPVYATRGTLSAVGERFELDGAEVISTGDWFEIGDLKFLPMSLSHDAFEPVGFVIDDGDSRAAVITDLGMVTNVVRHHLKDVALAVVESNHDAVMLRDGPYPWELKQRIKSRRGHLSNTQAANLISAIAHPGLKHVMVAHLSETNNLPELAKGEAEGALDGNNSKVHVCLQDKPSAVIMV
jgi:phosphoribosyl 1,2-cyclic phosphodiesterase